MRGAGQKRDRSETAGMFRAASGKIALRLELRVTKGVRKVVCRLCNVCGLDDALGEAAISAPCRGIGGR